jgi:hypothetical protein
MGLCHCEVLFTPLIQIMREGHDLDIISSSKQLFCLLAFNAMLQGEKNSFRNTSTSQAFVFVQILNDGFCFKVYPAGYF